MSFDYDEHELFGDQDPVHVGDSVWAVTCLECGALVDVPAKATHLIFHNRLVAPAIAKGGLPDTSDQS